MKTATYIFGLTAICAVVGADGGFEAEDTKEREVFRKMFTMKRVEQLRAVKQLMTFDEERREKLLDSMLDKFFSVLSKSKVELEASGLGLGGITVFPTNDDAKNALALVMENGCFLSDILLRFPDFLSAKLAANRDWETVYKWSVDFIHQSGLTDENTEQLMKLAMQESGMVEKDPDYNNPYRQAKRKVKRFEDPPPPTKKPKKKIQKGPKMSRPKNEL